MKWEKKYIYQKINYIKNIKINLQQNEKYESAKQKYAKNNKKKCKSANFASRTVLARCASAHASRESTRRSGDAASPI